MKTDEKPRCSWTHEERYSNIELNMSINYEERFIILRALSLLNDACNTIWQFERSEDVRRLMQRFKGELWIQEKS